MRGKITPWMMLAKETEEENDRKGHRLDGQIHSETDKRGTRRQERQERGREEYTYLAWQLDLGY